MTFIVRRGRQAFANWRDLDSAHVESDLNPAVQPWVQWNSSVNAQFASNTLVFDGVGASLFNIGGWSYENQPFTPYWGTDFDVNLSLNNTLQSQFFGAFVTAPWTYQQSTVGLAGLMFQLFHNSPIVTGGEYNRVQWMTLDSSGNQTVISENDLPGGDAWWSGWHTISIWVDNDITTRVTVDGSLFLFYTLPTAYQPSPGKRAFNFANRLFNTSAIRNFRAYDRVFDLNWSQVNYDNFNRADSSTIGTGWTKFGTNSGILTDSYAPTGTTDGNQAAITSTDTTSGNQRVECILGGAIAPSSLCDSSIYLRANAAGTSALALNWYSGKLFISALTGSLTSPTFTDFSPLTSGVSLASGTKLAFSVKDAASIGSGGVAWVEVNDQVVLFAGNIDATCPATNLRNGMRVSRAAFTNSGSFDDFRQFVAA